jgi:DNA/RNA-binding domain of Phe-tRNA-synthetase-like protein
MTTSTFTCDVSQDVLDLGVTVGFFVIHGLQNVDTHGHVARYQAAVLQEVTAGLSLASIKTDPILLGYRRLHEAVGCSNRRNIASPEKLLSLVLDTGRLPCVNPAVDLYNALSIKTHLSLGAHDLAYVAGNIHLQLTDGSECFQSLGAPEAKVARAGEYAYIDDAHDVLCRLEVRQAEKSKITPTTTDAFFIIQGNAATSVADIAAAMEELISVLTQCCGGSAQVLGIFSASRG